LARIADARRPLPPTATSTPHTTIGQRVAARDFDDTQRSVHRSLTEIHRELFMTTVETISALAGEQFGIDAQQIDADAPIQQLGADSLGYLEFLFELEERFQVSIDQEAVKQVQTLRELGALIDRLLAESPAQAG
jgi:acyl carrier protein